MGALCEGPGAGCARPNPVPPTAQRVRGKEAAGRAGEESRAVSNLLLRDSPGTAPGKLRSLSFLSSLLGSGYSASIPGTAPEAPGGTLHVIPGRFRGTRPRHGSGRPWQRRLP